MTCCSRDTFGIILGSLYILGSIVSIISSYIGYKELKKGDDPQSRNRLITDAKKSVTISLATIVISALFIVAVVEHFPYLILPWLVMGVYFSYLTCKTMYWWFRVAGIGGAAGYVFLLLLLIFLLAIGCQIGIFYFSCSLMLQIRQENIENTAGATLDYQQTSKSLL